MTPDLVDRWGERRGTEAAFDYLDLLIPQGQPKRSIPSHLMVSKVLPIAGLNFYLAFRLENLLFFEQLGKESKRLLMHHRAKKDRQS